MYVCIYIHMYMYTYIYHITNINKYIYIYIQTYGTWFKFAISVNLNKPNFPLRIDWSWRFANYEMHPELSVFGPGLGLKIQFNHAYYVLLCFIDPRVRKIRNEASSCLGIFSRTLRFYYVSSLPVGRGGFISSNLTQVSSIGRLLFNQPVDWSRSISTVDKDSPTWEYNQYWRLIRIHLLENTINVDHQ